VYDISQTDGDPLPSLTRTLEGDAPAAMIERLDAAAADLGAVVATANAADDPIIANGANGYATKRDDGTLHVVLSDRLSPAQRAKTYAHEIGHIALGHLDEDRSTAHTLRADREVQAESFAYVMSSSYGLDTGDFSFSYVSAWSGGDPKAVARSAARIASAVGPYCRDAA
jgi:hypothetical protein